MAVSILRPILERLRFPNLLFLYLLIWHMFLILSTFLRFSQPLSLPADQLRQCFFFYYSCLLSLCVLSSRQDPGITLLGVGWTTRIRFLMRSRLLAVRVQLLMAAKLETRTPRLALRILAATREFVQMWQFELY